jgi:dTDP-4-dehydrorhamnose 3,5-epimerase
MIDGVITKDLTTHADERGFFRELIRVNDDFFSEGFGQFSHSLVMEGVAKAWHIHKIQTDWLYVATGALKVALYDTRVDSSTHGQLMEMLLGAIYPAKVVKIPPGVAHGYKALEGPAHVLYIMSHTYNPSDEGRIPHNDASIGYDWTANAVIN